MTTASVCRVLGGSAVILADCSAIRTASVASHFIAPGLHQSRVTSHNSLLQRWRWIIRQLVLAGVRPLHFQLIEEQRRADNRRRRAADPIAHQRIVADRDQVAPYRPDVEFA